jgi:Tfp pilus assembly protein PilZ
LSSAGGARFHSPPIIMSDARRAARRVRLPGIQVVYASATGERRQARAVDLSREGLYIPSGTPMAVGKRLSLEIQPIGEPTAWSALGRVVWIRVADDGAERPAGMAVKFIDVEDAVSAAIERLLEARVPTERGLGVGDTILPTRSSGSTSPAREVSLAIDLIAPKNRPVLASEREPVVGAKVNGSEGTTAEEPKTASPSGAQEGAAERSWPEPPTKRRSRPGFVLFALVIAAGVAGYTFRYRIRAFSHVAASTIAKRLQ